MFGSTPTPSGIQGAISSVGMTGINNCIASSTYPDTVCADITAQGGGGSFKNRKPIGRVHQWIRSAIRESQQPTLQLMDQKVVGVVLFGVVAMVAAVTSLTTSGCSVV